MTLSGRANGILRKSEGVGVLSVKISYQFSWKELHGLTQDFTQSFTVHHTLRKFFYTGSYPRKMFNDVFSETKSQRSTVEDTPGSVSSDAYRFLQIYI